jgi:predicted TIM-barrel enzyme
MMREAIISKLKGMRSEDLPIIIAGVGCGLTAHAAVTGGADLLAVYSTAIYRMKGMPAVLSFLPYDNANEITFETAPEVIANAADIPVLFGLGAHDVRISPSALIDKAVSLGAAGIINEPFSRMYGHPLIDELEKSGLGFSRELELIKQADQSGLMTLGWVFNQDEAIRMADVGAQMIGVMVAITHRKNARQDEYILEAINTISSIVTAVKASRANVFIFGHGGPLVSPEIVNAVMNQTQMDGFFTGSTGERFPVEQSVAETIRQYKTMKSQIIDKTWR